MCMASTDQFMTLKEGTDGDEYDAAFWDDPNLIFPPQILPTYNSFNIAYPKHKDPVI